MSSGTPPVTDLILHRESMLLIRSVHDWGDDWVAVDVDPRDSAGFADHSGAIPVWVGLEYMAQAVNVFASLISITHGGPAKAGFLLGTRDYRGHVRSFDTETKLRVVAEQVFLDEDFFALFQCRIQAGERILATADIKVVQADDLHSAMEDNA